ncbi:MAG: HAMP domain-containing histidine kinase [Candidatus Nomurabacteria bacterium]|nr:MAG: HAMP domain-containing histidine kinase [Candidatus Nomurabacteria bacterium]
MSISLLFSLAIYQGATDEIGNRLSQFQDSLESPDPNIFLPPNHRLYSAFRDNQQDKASRNILVMLLYVNLLIFFCGGALSYVLARRTLRNIEESHDAQSRFTSDASHELRTPLAAMKTELEVALRDTKLTKDDMRELLTSNLEEVNKLTSLSKTLLQLSRLDHANLELENVNLGNVATEVAQRYDKNAKRINLKLPNEPVIIRANTATIEELLTILVDNALKYSPQDSRIKATLAYDARSASFSITNKGDGIPSDKLPHIFERFYRANESHSGGGSGLGLSLAKEIVEIYKGELSVSSKPKSNTTFTVTLPLSRKHQA